MRKILLSLACLAALTAQAQAQNYAATAGAGLTFGANLVGGVLYPQQNMCDPTTPARCVVVDASGRITLAPNQSVNVAQINGVTVLMGNGATGTGSQRMTIANDNTIPTGWPTAANQTIVNTWAGGTLGAMASYGTSPGAVLVPGVNAYVTNTLAAVGNNGDNVAAGAGAASPVVNYNYAFDGTTWDRVRTVTVDPCEASAQTYAPISITTATTTRIVTPSASNKTYICGLMLVTAAANNVGIVEGTGGTCGTGTAGVIGGTTAANGPNYSANGGMVLQAGKVAHAVTAGTNVDLCLITSAATPLAGGIKYVQAP